MPNFSRQGEVGAIRPTMCEHQLVDFDDRGILGWGTGSALMFGTSSLLRCTSHTVRLALARGRRLGRSPSSRAGGRRIVADEFDCPRPVDSDLNRLGGIYDALLRDRVADFNEVLIHD